MPTGVQRKCQGERRKCSLVRCGQEFDVRQPDHAYCCPTHRKYAQQLRKAFALATEQLRVGFLGR